MRPRGVRRGIGRTRTPSRRSAPLAPSRRGCRRARTRASRSSRISRVRISDLTPFHSTVAEW